MTNKKNRFRNLGFILASVSVGTLFVAPVVASCTLFESAVPPPNSDSNKPQKPGEGDNQTNPDINSPQEPGEGDSQTNPDNNSPQEPGGDNNQNPGDGQPPIIPPQPPKPEKPTFPQGVTEANFPAYYNDPVSDQDFVNPRPPFVGVFYPTPEDQEYGPNGDLVAANQFITGTTLGNSQYDYIAKRSVSLKVTNPPDPNQFDKLPESGSGTGWWMDYLKTTDGSYPTTWYLGTSLHVADLVVNSQDNYGERDLGYFNGRNSISFEIGHIQNIAQPVTYEALNQLPKTLFAAANFLDGNAEQIYGKEYLKNHDLEWFTIDELMLDFAVLEVTFNNVEQAQRLTYNLATDQSQPLVKFKDGMYFNEKNREQLQQTNDLFVAGFPSAHDNPQSKTFTINKLERDRANVSTGTKFGNRTQMEVINSKGRYLPGMFDAMSEYNFNMVFDVLEYKRAGISYELELTNLYPGASGSMAVNNQNEIIGVYWGFMAGGNKDNQPRIGFVDPLISKYGYIDKFGNYAPFRYDLIYGGIQRQIKSYKSQMQKHHAGQATPLLGTL